MRTKQQSSQRRVRCASTLFTLAAIILFGCSQKALAQQWNTNGNNISSANTGNVGVGTTSPGSKLDVNGRIRQTGSATDAGYLLTNSSLFASTTALNPGIAFYGGNGFNALYGADLGYNSATGRYRTRVFSGVDIADVAFGRQQNAQGNPTQSAFTEFLTVRGDTGNVGIGTAGPNYRLDVQGGLINASGGLCIAGDCKTNWSQVGGGNGAVSSVFGRTGAVVAATNDYTWAQINKSTSSLSDIATRNAGDLNSGTLPDARFPAILPAVSGANLTNLNASNLASGTVVAARLGSGTANSTTFLRGDNTWAVPSGSQWTNGSNSIYYNSGNVGIGTISPNSNYTLDVNGNTNVTGNINVTGYINAKYQDLAEWVPSANALPAGTVVTLDPTKSNHVEASAKAYDTRVAGVISSQPGIVLGERGENKVLVATTGRVRIKVDASDGPIAVGDLLVTSDIPGVAMKSQPVNLGGIQLHRPGTLIGKALEPLAKGKGEILVLLSLQ